MKSDGVRVCVPVSDKYEALFEDLVKTLVFFVCVLLEGMGEL